MNTVSRRAFLGTSAIGAAAPFVPLAAGRSTLAATRRWMDGGLPESFPSQDPQLAQKIVGLSHANIDGVRELVVNRPALAKAAWDWGFGDWETALGAASHVGRPDIAELLIANGARPDIFTFTMLGQVDVVRAICTANPGIQKLHGPHGITLLQHAMNAGDSASAVVSYLQELGDADTGQPHTPLEETNAQGYIGQYEPDIAPGVTFAVAYHDKRKTLTFTRDDRSVRILMNRGNHEFNPAGTPEVRITFEVQDGVAKSLTIRDGDLVVNASRRAT